jgi:hypothetical protein
VATLEPHPPLPPRPPYAGPAPRAGRKAVAAMVLGIVGLVLGFLFVPLACCVLAVVFGSLALQEIGRQGPERVGGRGQAVAGIVLGVIGLAGWAIVIALLAAGSRF